jgi:hypothetical protein
MLIFAYEKKKEVWSKDHLHFKEEFLTINRIHVQSMQENSFIFFIKYYL